MNSEGRMIAASFGAIPALIRSKRSTGRPKDLLVVPELEALLEMSKKS